MEENFKVIDFNRVPQWVEEELKNADFYQWTLTRCLRRWIIM